MMQRIAFFHIEKTAGSTLRTILQRNYSLGELYPMYTEQARTAFRQMAPEVKDKDQGCLRPLLPGCGGLASSRHGVHHHAARSGRARGIPLLLRQICAKNRSRGPITATRVSRAARPPADRQRDGAVPLRG